MITHSILFKEANDLKALVDVNDYLRQLYKENNSMEFPSIVVLGEQSHGKTSLIENITNLNLPRGTGIQTRVPTEIRLRNSSVNSYKIFYKPKSQFETKVIDFNEANLEEIMRKVQAEVTGSDNQITDDLIVLQIERVDLLPLTFVDLPGYIVQSSTDVNYDVEDVIKKIYIKYICNPNNQLLVVVNAANDIENSQIIKLCRKYDPQCERVMLCTNKIDLRPSLGFDQYLKGAGLFNITRIFFVRNKTDEERRENRRLDDIREIEKTFIQKHPELSKYNKKTLGILALRNYLVEMQKENIFPAIKTNYEHVIKILSERRTEQFDIIKYSLEPEEFRNYLRKSLDKVFAESEQTFSENNKSFHKTNYYRNLHNEELDKTFEAKFPTMNTSVKYSVQLIEDDYHVTFDCKFANVFYAEIITQNQIKFSLQLDTDKKTAFVRFKKSKFTISIWLMQDYDYFTFQNKVKNLYLFYKTQYSFDYFTSENFASTYKNHEQLQPFEESMIDDVSSIIHQEILTRQIIPKFLCEVEEFITFSKDFIQGMYIKKIGTYFKDYPFVLQEIQGYIKKYFLELFVFLNQVFEILIENLYEKNLFNKNDKFLFEFLQNSFENKPCDERRQVIAKLIGIENFDFDNVSSIGQNTNVFDCGAKLYLTITYKFQFFIENLVLTIKKKLINETLVKLKECLINMLDDKKFKDAEELRVLMRPNEELYARQMFLKDEIQKAEGAIEKMKTLRSKFINLQSEFDYIDQIQAVKLENLDEHLRKKITNFLNANN